jgi:hypothetical protein
MDELREEMNRAWDQDEANRAELAGQTEQDPPTGEQETTLADELGAAHDEKSTEATDIEAQGEGEGKSDASLDQAKAEPEKAEPKAVAQEDIKAPASWSAKARESWKTLPSEAKAEIDKREREVNQVLQQSASARKGMAQLQQTLAPHAQRLINSGVENPMQAIGTLLATEGRLRQGSSHEKATTIANLIKQYGVDIETLDGVLSGQGVASQGASQGRVNADIDAILNEKLAPFQQYMTEQQKWQQAQLNRSKQEASQSVAQFSQNAEFINDVRNDMADLMDLAAARGREMSLEEAYNRACMAHPEVSQILEQRKAQQAMMGTSEAAKAKKRAAVSITGQQGGQTTRGADSLRAQIAQAWEESLGG